MTEKAAETRLGVSLTNLDQPLFDGSDATKRDLVNYLEAIADRIIPPLYNRLLSVMRVRPGQPPFMQKNMPKYTPEWIRTESVWAQASKRDIAYALCNDARTLLWFANQRAVEYHVSLTTTEHPDHVSYLVLDIDPPSSAHEFASAAQGALLVRQALDDLALVGAVKTSGAKGVHIYVPIDTDVAVADAAAATRAIAARAARLDPVLATTAYVVEEREGKVFIDSTRAGGATVASVYSPRLRPGTPVSFPVGWDDLAQVSPADFTIRSALGLLDGADPWADQLPEPQSLPADLVAEGHEIPVARVQAMHAGKRRARQRQQD